MAVETLRPNANGDATNWPSLTGSSHWAALSDDSDTTYIRNNTSSNTEDDLNLGAPVVIQPSYTIDTIDVRFRARTESSATGTSITVGLRLGGVNSLASAETGVTGSETTYTRTNISRPGGGGWSYADLADLQVVAIGNGGSAAIRLFELWVDVNYSEATPVAVSDAGTGTDTTAILISSDLTESGTGTDDLGVTVLAPDLTDSGTGSDAVLVEVFTPVDLTETGTATDTVTVDKTDHISISDSGTATDTASVFASTDLTDSAAGTDELTGLNRFLTDSGTGTETISILEIPFTQVLPPSRLGNLYDLVLMARVPQQSGAPLYLDVDPIEWTQLGFTNELSVPSELQASCQIGSLTPGLIERLRNLAENPSELWLYRNGRLVFSGPLRGGQVNGEQLTLTAKGVLDYLKHMFVTTDLTYKTVDQHTIVKNLVDHWQNLDYGNFGIDTSNITASGVTRDVTYLKNELHNIAQRVQDLGKAAEGFDFEVDPETRALQLWHPQKGVDRSTGEDAVVFDSRNITSSSVMFSASANDIATEAFGTGNAAVGDGPKYATAINVELRAKYGRAGVTGTWSEIPDQASLDNHVQALVDARSEALVVPGPEARETPDSDITSYSVGDTILYQPNELLMVSAPFRIRKQTVRVSGSGRETVSLEFV